MCDSLKNNYVFPSWIYEFFAKKPHRNEARQVWEQYFETLPIQLNNYCLIMAGYYEQTQPLVLLQILSTHSQIPLKGAHKIYFPLTQCVTSVPSLTYLKKYFQMKDRLSFERCTYLCLWEKQKLIRLKCLRSHLCLPYESLDIDTNCKIPFAFQISQRTKQQIQNSIQMLYTSLQRDMVSTDRFEILKLLKEEIEKVMNTI